MKRVAVIVCMLLAVAASAEEYLPTMDDLAWIAGCWEGGGIGAAYQEHWMGPDGQSMIGMSRTVSEDSTVAFEFLRIHQELDGSIYYTSIPSGQKQASFKLVKYDKGHVVFENSNHDFPQRIVYKLGKDGELVATIEGTSKGALKQVDFPMRRGACK